MASSKETGVKPESDIKDPSHPLDPILNTAKEHKVSGGCLFFDKIVRGELKEIITPQKPWCYWTAELYGEGIKGQGGLGMLASDTLKITSKLKIPMNFITPFYTKERFYKVDNNFKQEIDVENVAPEDRGFKDTGINVSVSTEVHPEVKLDVYTKEIGSVRVVTITEPNVGELYEGDPWGDRRLYQNIILGFGGYKAIKAMGLKPSMNQQLNESPTVFSALARLDDHLSEEKDFKKALTDVKGQTIYTNHSNVPAAEPIFSLSQFEHFVFPNIRNEELKSWLKKKIEGKGGRINLSTLAIELSGKRNGVSKAHARDASNIYKDCDGCDVRFDAVTNGICIDRWGDKELLDSYRKNKVIDEFDLPTENYKANLDVVFETELMLNKYNGKERLREHLLERKDQYGKSVNIPKDAKIFDWTRRLAEYKRPGMLFEKPEVFTKILEQENIHLIMAGNVHPSDTAMSIELQRILKIINGNEILKKRVHFIQNYDEELGRVLSHGSDVSINTPIVGHEACGTSVWKRILGNCILISTDDGGLADSSVKAMEEGRTDFKPAYLQITGRTYEEEVASLYDKLLTASLILNGKEERLWGEFVKGQLKEYLPAISGARMEKDYLNLGFPV